MQYDVFISHASQDKDAVARPLADALTQRGVKVWLDERQLHVGDSIHRKIDRALADSRFCIVILSPAYVKSEWTNKELDAFFSKEKQQEKSILPILHNLSIEEVSGFSPMLTDKVSLTTRDDIHSLADKILRSIQVSADNGDNNPTLPTPSGHGSNVSMRKPPTLILSGLVGTAIAGLAAIFIYSGNWVKINATELILSGIVAVVVAAGLAAIFIYSGNGVRINATDQAVVNTGNIGGNLVIHQGDSKEERQRKIKQAKQLVSQEIISNLLAMDDRLGYVEVVFKEDEITNNINQTNREIVPAIAQYFEVGISKLLAEANVGSLRQTMNSSPLRSDFGTTLTQTLVDSGADVSTVRIFYDQLKNVELKTENLFGDLTKLASHRHSQNPDELKYYEQNIKLAVKSLQLNSEAAHLAGLNALRSLDVSPSDVSLQLSRLVYLQPNSLPSGQELTQRMMQNMLKLEQMISEKAAFIESGKELVEGGIDEVKSLVGQLEIRPTDKPEDVFWKAASLRRLGQVNEAVAALQQSKQMFPSMDDATKTYVDTAIAFASQAKSFGVESGLYAVNITDEGHARKIGLQAGDIVVEYDGKPLVLAQDIVSAQQALGDKAETQVVFLHMNPATGKFDYHKVSVPAGKLGVMFQPI